MKIKLPTAAIGAGALLAAVSTAVTGAGLAKYTVDKTTFSIPTALTAEPGNAERGRKTAIDRKKGNCLACHTMPIPEQAFHGRIGPPLNTVGARLNEAQLRLRVVNSKLVNPATIMPAFYKNDGFTRVLKKFEGKTILSAQEVEDVIAYLKTLK